MNKSKNTVQAMQLPVNQLRPFEGHPFQVKDDAEMEQLVWSILTQGLLTPITVRPLENNEYEVISGHRRLHACQKAGIETVPALIYALNRDAAAIALVDSNLHREKILPSEKAFAYKLKMDAMSRQGQRTDLTCGQVGHKSRDSISDSESGRTIQRYIRLTYLQKPILDLVDAGRIAFSPAVELSYLTKLEQAELWDIMQSEDCTPSLSQAVRMKKLSKIAQLTPEIIFDIMSEEKANQKERVRIDVSQLRKFFPQSYTTAQMEKSILRMLEEQHKKKQRSIEIR